jgi:hypothetical protein
MIKIDVDPIVLTSLKAAFPKANSAQKALDKYVELFEKMLNQTELNGITKYNPSLGVYSISLFKLNEKSPRIGSEKLRLHKWLESNQLSLHKTVQLGAIGGSNKGPSLISPSHLITLKTVDDSNDAQTAFKELHPNFDKLSAQQLANDYDCCNVDVDSLSNYIKLLSSNPTLSRSDKKVLAQATRILAAAQYQKNIYYQKKKYSNFGRTYYEGLSVQNIRKDLREAMLGNSFEYDMRSSVIAWKLGYAQTCIASTKKLKGKTIEDAFPRCHQYWLNKSVLINTIKVHVFIDDYYSDDKQIKLVKEAMTALNFGARKSSHSYINHNGVYCKQAMGTIFKETDECERFLQFAPIVEFIEEQKILNKTIMNLAKVNQPDLLNQPFLLNKQSKLKRQKTLAYLYQNEETRVMNIVRANAKLQGLTVLANIHDAIVLKRELNNKVLKKIHADIHNQTGNTFWHLNTKKLKRTA